jgi:hypothetical protein
MILPDLQATRYHADDVGTGPSLSSSIANVLLTRSPLHAWTNHPKLNPNYQKRDDEKFDVGTIAHALLLEGVSVVDVCDFPDWRTNAAKEARELSRSHGRIPLLGKQYDDVMGMVNAVALQLQAFGPPVPLTGGKPEQTLVWTDPTHGVACRARIDWLHDDYSTIDDLKTTTRSAHPDAWARNLYSYGCDVQAAFYVRGLKQLFPRVERDGVEWRWLVVETSPPYALSVVTPSPAVLELADAKVDTAMRLWAQCLETGIWPGYPTRVATAELPAWEEARWLEREDA